MTDASRVGEVERGKLSRRGCRFYAPVRLPAQGRWLLYRDGRTVESYIPVEVDEGQPRFGGFGPLRLRRGS